MRRRTTGRSRYCFELNGQQRIVRVPDRSAIAKTVARRKADSDDITHIAAPMPGLVTTVIVQPGHAVRTGEVLLAISAMKMETSILSTRDGKIGEVEGLIAALRRIKAARRRVVMK